jgi:AraC-like DNA-binding protein
MAADTEVLLPPRIDHAEIGTMDGPTLNLLSRLFERLDDCPFFIKNESLHYTAANPAMARLCGAESPAMLIGRRADAFFPKLVAERYEALDREVIETGRTLNDRLDLVAAGKGAAAWLLFSRHPVQDGEGRIIGVAASARRLAGAEASTPVYARLARAVARLEAAPEASLNLPSLARAAGVSPSQIERDFRAAFGVSPQRFLHKLRITRALPLLGKGAAIADVALAVGYSDQSAFTRRFHRVMGCTPSAWRRIQHDRNREKKP